MATRASASARRISRTSAGFTMTVRNLLANKTMPAWISVAADEAHVLNVCITPERQGRGYGRHLLRALVKLAGDHGAARIFLEVRPSNPAAIALYHEEGFNEIGRRPRYYPSKDGREDALVMAMELVGEDISRMPPL